MRIKILLLLALVSICITLSGQKSGKKVIITGIVTDTANKPVDHALIYIDGKKTKYFTESDGSFEISVKSSAEKIRAVSASGSGEAVITGTSAIAISLKPDNNQGAPSKPGISSGSSSSKTKPGSETKKTVLTSYSNIYIMIRSEVPGVQVEGTSVFVQGRKSFGGDNSVLYVVDGIPTNQINDLSPSDVKSFRLIKDSEAAIYGMRGANGVLDITTKRGGDK